MAFPKPIYTYYCDGELACVYTTVSILLIVRKLFQSHENIMRCMVSSDFETGRTHFALIHKQINLCFLCAFIKLSKLSIFCTEVFVLSLSKYNYNIVFNSTALLSLVINVITKKQTYILSDLFTNLFERFAYRGRWLSNFSFN